jgi:hypothetical protein
MYLFYPALGLVISISCISMILPGEWSKRFVSLILIIGVLIWLQGNILVWEYGVIGKEDVDWSQYHWRSGIDLAMWILLLIGAAVFYKKIYKLSAFVSLVFLFLQSGLLAIDSFNNPEIWKNRKDATVLLSPPDAVYEFSLTENIIHVILDEFQSTVFQDIIDKEMDHYSEELEGFTFFRNTSASYATTLMSIPAILSGEIYGNDEVIRDFIARIYTGNTITNKLYDDGYDVDLMASLDWYGRGRYSNWFFIPIPYGGTEETHLRTNAYLVLDLTLFRFLPHLLKKAKSEYQLQIGSPIEVIEGDDLTSYEAKRHFSHKLFLQEMIENMSAVRSSPVYKFIHLQTTHYPTVLDANCNYAGVILDFTWENIEIQDKCSLDHFLEFLGRLKQLGIYESSLIIVHADHGYFRVPDSRKRLNSLDYGWQVYDEFESEEHFAQVVSASASLLAIKRPYDKGKLRVSDSEVALSDLPATISTILSGSKNNFPGRSVYGVHPSEERERTFFYYKEFAQQHHRYFKMMREYSIRGSIFDRNSWSLKNTLVSKDISFKTNQVDIGTRGAKKFLIAGWGSAEREAKENIDFTWALGKKATVYLTLPKGNTTVTATVKSLFPPEFQTVFVKVDGRSVGSWTNASRGKWETHSLTINPDEERPAVSVIEFLFSHNYEPTERDRRPLALMFDSITID